MTNDNEVMGSFLVGGLAGTLVGAALILGVNSCVGPQVEEAKVFQEEGKPTAMRLYVKKSADKIMVEDLGSERYIPLRNHLDSVSDFADRELEKARIKKQVRWYEE